MNALGVLLAVPLGAVVKIFLSRAQGVYLGSDFYLRPPAPVEGALAPSPVLAEAPVAAMTELPSVKTSSVPPSRTAR